MVIKVVENGWNQVEMLEPNIVLNIPVSILYRKMMPVNYGLPLIFIMVYRK